MKARNKSFFAALLVVTGMLITACSTSKQTASQSGNDIDSIKIEVSSKVSTSHIMLTGEKKAMVTLKGNPVHVLSVKETKRLKSLAEQLFIKKTRRIILSEEKACGRTSYPNFIVILYHNGKSESLRYDMGREAGGITQCTSKNIRYSDSFRKFMFSVLRILD